MMTDGVRIRRPNSAVTLWHWQTGPAAPGPSGGGIISAQWTDSPRTANPRPIGHQSDKGKPLNSAFSPPSFTQSIVAYDVSSNDDGVRLVVARGATQSQFVCIRAVSIARGEYSRKSDDITTINHYNHISLFIFWWMALPEQSTAPNPNGGFMKATQQSTVS